jgi:hypothetical protein
MSGGGDGAIRLASSRRRRDGALRREQQRGLPLLLRCDARARWGSDGASGRSLTATTARAEKAARVFVGGGGEERSGQEG